MPPFPSSVGEVVDGLLVPPDQLLATADLATWKRAHLAAALPSVLQLVRAFAQALRHDAPLIRTAPILFRTLTHMLAAAKATALTATAALSGTKRRQTPRDRP